MITRTGEARNYRTNYTTSDYYVAYLDFLGTKQYISSKDSDNHLNDLALIYQDTINYLNFDKKDIFIKIFSDNILIAQKVYENSEEDKDNLLKFFNLCMTIQNVALQRGYLIRGAIVKDKFFHNKLFVYGKALIDAVEMEEKIAIYPRIIAKENFANMYREFFILDSDGCYYLNNYLDSLNEGVYVYFKINLLKFLKQYKNDSKIKQKIMWFINRYNYMLESTKFMKLHTIKEKEISEATK